MKNGYKEPDILEEYSESMEDSQLKGLRLPTIRRFPKYLRVLWEFSSHGREVVSSDKIAHKLNLDPITVRKDLAFTGILGKPRVGYTIADLIEGIEKIINSQSQTNVYLFGAGNLGTALLGYGGFKKHGYNLIAAFDSDPAKIGIKLHDKPVYGISHIREVVEISDHDIAVLCVPENVAQETADIIIEAGIKSIWNFTSNELKVPESVTVLTEDLASSLAVLSVTRKRNSFK